MTKPYRDDGQAVSEYNLLDYKSAVQLNGKINRSKPIDEGWTLEYAIPISALVALDHENKTLSDGDQWKVNFQRAQRRLEVVGEYYKLKENPDTEQPYGPDFWVWSPQGLNNIHYPEMWGIIQFSSVEAGERQVQFRPSSAERCRWVLRQVYYQMKEFYLNQGYYTNDLTALNMERELA